MNAIPEILIARAQFSIISESTHLEYNSAFLRLDGKHWREYAEEHKLSKRSASVLRAAWRRSIAEKILWTVDTAENVDTAQARQKHEEAAKSLSLELVSDLALPAYQAPAGTQRPGQKSKRKSLKGLPDDWRDLMLESVKIEDQSPLLVMTLTGCRPAELKKGVQVIASDHLLAFIIQGAKVKENAGQPQRAIAIDPKSVLSRNHALINKLFQSQPTVRIDDDQRFQKRIYRIAKKLGFKQVSCYALRHQLAADLKSNKNTRTEIALSLGHQSERTQRFYGNHKQGNKGGLVIEVHAHAAIPPRPQAKQSFDQMRGSAGESAPASAMQSTLIPTTVMPDLKSTQSKEISKPSGHEIWR
ncbi:MAG TPA: hypothetical protein VMV35_03370 [Halothiobacillus sp.]|nr:hypothetical protein [Halothiobacillus sp.]